MSNIIRSFRITNSVYRPRSETMDGRTTPFRLPSYTTEPSEPVPDVVIEGVPPVGKPEKPQRRNDT